MERINDRLYNWASDIEPETLRQAERTARLPIIHDHLALMPDAHFGIGATVGSVFATEGAVIPAAVGVDIGCGMMAYQVGMTADGLPDDLERFLPMVEQAVPAGVGKGRNDSGRTASEWFAANQPRTELDSPTAKRALDQLGSLGSGNHFVEVCLDENDAVWLVLHSGSRGIGNKLAKKHINRAGVLAKEAHLILEDPELAYFVQGTDEFDDYIADMLWAQAYAMVNREIMMTALLAAFDKFVGPRPRVSEKHLTRVNCHHNFTQLEQFPSLTNVPGGVETRDRRPLWITRKGAIKADRGDLGVIPGSMGTRSYIVRGLGNHLSWNSCSHGAGRRMSRGAAKRQFTVEDLAEQMKGKVWLSDRAKLLLDEIPSGYKDIDQVMADQKDLVEVVHTLHQILNYKGS